MKRSRSFDRQLCVQWLKSDVRRRRAAALSSTAGVAALSGALSLGLAVMPGSAQAAAIVISSPQVGTQYLANGDSLTITPTGSITAPGDSGVQPLSAGVTTGDISNAGTIDAGIDGISIYSSSTVDGNITNTGAISGGSFMGVAIWDGSSVTGDITNSGSIAGNYEGIAVSSSGEVQGSIRNEAGGQIDAGGSGILVYGGSSVGQDVVNDGTIGASGNVGIAGIEVLSTAAIGGNIVNTGAINADQDGIRIEGYGSVGGAIVNTGTVTAGDDAISVSSSSQVQGNISNAGTLDGGLSVLGTGAGGGIDLASTGIIDIGESESVLSGNLDLTGSDLFAITLMNFGDYTDAPMTVMGDALIGGDLMLDFVSGFSVAGGERFTLFDIGGTRSGLFANYADDALVGHFDGWVDLRIDYTAEGDIDLYSVYVPEPSSLALLGIGALGWAGRRRRRG